MFRLSPEPRSGQSRVSRIDLSLFFASFLPLPNLHARRLPDLISVSKCISAGSAGLAHSCPSNIPNAGTEGSDSDRRHLLFPPRIPFTTHALQQSKIRAKIILCFHALTTGIFTKPFPLLWLQTRGGRCFSNLKSHPFQWQRQHTVPPATPFLSNVYFTLLSIPGAGSTAERRASTSQALFTIITHHPLQYPRPPFVYSNGWTSR